MLPIIRQKHAISEKLYFVYYLRNGVLSSEISPKIIGLHKVQSSLACRLQVRNSRSNLLRIRVLRNLPDCKKRQRLITLEKNPQNAWRIFRSLSTKISARLYFVYCLRNFVCEEAKKPNDSRITQSTALRIPPSPRL